MDLGTLVLLLVVVAVVIVVGFQLYRRSSARPAPDRPTTSADRGEYETPTPRPGDDRAAGPAAESTAAPEAGDPSPGRPAPREGTTPDATPPSTAETGEDPSRGR